MGLRDKLVAHYRCEEASGNLLDAFGSTHLQDLGATAVGTAKVGAGRGGSSGGWISENTMPAALNFQNTNFGIAGWFFLTSNVTALRDLVIADVGGGIADCAYVLFFDSTGQRFKFRVYDGSGGTSTVIASDFGLPVTNTYYYVECGHDADNNQIWISVNGGTRNSAGHTTGVRSASFLEIGGSSIDSSGTNRFDEISFFNAVPTEAEIDAVYNGGSGLAFPWVPAPTVLSATANGFDQIDLTWTDNSSNEAGFQIERSATGVGGWSTVGTNAAGDTTFSDTGLDPETQYFYRVTATNTNLGNSAYTSTANATTDPLPVSGGGIGSAKFNRYLCPRRS